VQVKAFSSNHFESAGLGDYRSISEVESFAADAGYPRLK
jgi:hypothetical protein